MTPGMIGPPGELEARAGAFSIWVADVIGLGAAFNKLVADCKAVDARDRRSLIVQTMSTPVASA